MTSAEGSLGARTIPPAERLIFALDVGSTGDALTLVDRLGDAVLFYKLGLELFMASGPEYGSLVDTLVQRGKKVMVDLKLFDVPETVGRAVRRLGELGPTFATVHGNDKMLEAAVKEKGDVGILAVTALTSLDRGDLDDLGFKCDVEDLVLSRAKRAIEIGCDGVVSSGLEARALRQAHGEGFIILTPGIRPVENTDDQKRTVDLEAAFGNGVDYVVVGRPIRDADDPVAAAQSIQKRISALFR